MRIVGGKWRGKPIEAPKDDKVTRPTTDRMREAIASMVLSAEDLDLTGISVLDAFAGSGAMGLELVSRGAARCTFVDRDKPSVDRIGRTARTMASPHEYALVRGDVTTLAQRGRIVGAPFGIVFLDPPYAMEAAEVSRLVDALAANGLLTADALVVYERSAKSPELDCTHARPLRSRKHGITSVDLLRIGEENG